MSEIGLVEYFGMGEAIGIKSPNIKDYIVKSQVTATYFYSAYPDASVRDIRKAMKVKSGLDVLLDAASS